MKCCDVREAYTMWAAAALIIEGRRPAGVICCVEVLEESANMGLTAFVASGGSLDLDVAWAVQQAAR